MTAEQLLQKFDKKYKEQNQYWLGLFDCLDKTVDKEFLIEYGHNFSFRKLYQNHHKFLVEPLKEIFSDLESLKKTKKNKMKWGNIIKRLPEVIDVNIPNFLEHLKILRGELDSEALIALFEIGAPEEIFTIFNNKLKSNKGWGYKILVESKIFSKISEKFIKDNIEQFGSYWNPIKRAFGKRIFSKEFIENVFSKCLSTRETVEELFLKQPVQIDLVKKHLSQLVDLKLDFERYLSVNKNVPADDRKKILEIIKQYRDLV
jgi:hypothetical protein